MSDIRSIESQVQFMGDEWAYELSFDGTCIVIRQKSEPSHLSAVNTMHFTYAELDRIIAERGHFKKLIEFDQSATQLAAE